MNNKKKSVPVWFKLNEDNNNSSQIRKTKTTKS